MTAPDELVTRLGLVPHPEGGWYRETWRAEAPAGERAAGTAIVYLLRSGERSHWHRVDADELWLHQGGAPMVLRVAGPDGTDEPTEHRLGLGLDGVPQAVVPAGWWQSAEPAGEWSLVGCVVIPGFEFAGFELAPPDWTPS